MDLLLFQEKSLILLQQMHSFIKAKNEILQHISGNEMLPGNEMLLANQSEYIYDFTVKFCCL